MRRLLIPLLFALALPALAQNRPADLQPVPEPPPGSRITASAPAGWMWTGRREPS